VITFEQARDRVNQYIKSHPREFRFICFFAVFALVWMQADNIQSFTNGFFDGLYDARMQ